MTQTSQPVLSLANYRSCAAFSPSPLLLLLPIACGLVAISVHVAAGGRRGPCDALWGGCPCLHAILALAPRNDGPILFAAGLPPNLAAHSTQQSCPILRSRGQAAQGFGKSRLRSNSVHVSLIEQCTAQAKGALHHSELGNGPLTGADQGQAALQRCALRFVPVGALHPAACLQWAWALAHWAARKDPAGRPARAPSRPCPPFAAPTSCTRWKKLPAPIA